MGGRMVVTMIETSGIEGRIDGGAVVLPTELLR
jgi:hypothetical protein